MKPCDQGFAGMRIQSDPMAISDSSKSYKIRSSVRNGPQVANLVYDLVSADK